MCEKRLGKRSRFLLELNEKPNEGGRVATTLSGFFKCSAAQLIQLFRTRFYGQMLQKAGFVRKFPS